MIQDMIQECYCYVNNEQAKALKELGFPQNTVTHCGYYYDEYGVIADFIRDIREIPNLINDMYFAPMLSTVSKWLREEKNLHICIDLENSKDYNCWIKYYDKTDDCMRETPCGLIGRYEDVLSKGIDKCIEVLKSKLT